MSQAMTLQDVQALLVGVDPTIEHYESTRKNADAYAVWYEFQRTGLHAGNLLPEKGWRFQVDYFTRLEYDPLAAQYETALESCPAIAYEYLVDYEPDTGYIHHIFDCVVTGQ